MTRWMKYSLVACGIIFLLLLSSMLIVPWQIKKQGIAWIDTETNRTLSIEKVYFNPFTLTVELNGLNLSEQNNKSPFISFERLMLSISSRSLIDWALILDRVELGTFHINLEQFDKQEFNFSDFTRLGGDKPPQTVKETEEPLHFSLNNIVLSEGSIDFTDHTSLRKTPHTIRQLNISVPFIGNIPYLTDEYVEPLLSLLLNGSEIRAEGHLKPFHESIETSLTLLLDEIDLAFYAYHFPLPLPIEVKSGEIDAVIDLTYRISLAEQPKLLLGGEMALTELDLRHKDESPLFRMPIMILDLDWAEIFQQDINLFSLDFYQPEVFISRDRQGIWNFDPFLPAPSEPSENIEPENEPSGLLLLTSESVEIHDGKVHFSDELPPGGFNDEIEQINLRLLQLSTHPEQTTETFFALRTGSGLTLSIHSDLQITPLLGQADFQVNSIPLAPYYPYLAEQIISPIKGNLDLGGRVHFDAKGNVRLEQGGLDLTKIKVPFTGEDLFELETLSVDGISADLSTQQLEIREIALKDGDLKASLLADGSPSPLGLLHQEQESEPEDSSSLDEPAEETDPWQLRIGSIATNNLNIRFSDRTREGVPEVRLHQIDFALKNLTVPESQQSPFSLSFRIAEKGTFAIDGTVAHTPLHLKATSSLKNLELADYNGFLPDNLNLALASGKLFTTLGIELNEHAEGLTGNFQGELALNSLSVLDPLDQSEMLAWETLQLSKIDGEIAPLKFHVRDIALSDYSAKIQITPDGRINLQNVTSEQPEEEQAEELADEPATEFTDEENGTQPDIRIETVTLQGGTVAFTDRHLATPFSTTMYKLGGRISGLSSDSGMLADVDLRGQLENHSPLKISGNINPLQENLYTDIKMSFEDIDLSPMSTYSGTYLGYMIEKGKLHLNLKYLIEEQKIDASNQVFIDQFTFGEKVESEQATSLPVPLAVALLKDSNGEIHLDVPVSGDLNDPDFSVAGAVFTILKNLLIKAATSPFALLGSLLGGDEDFTNITFESGLTSLSASSEQKLRKLAQILSDRPGLQLEISGFVDQENDPEGYRKEQLRQNMLAAKSAELAKQEIELPADEPLEIAHEEYSTYLLRVYKDATFPRPRNFIGMLKKLPDSEMEKLLLSNIIVGENELQELAKQRAMATRDALTATNEELRARIFLKKTDIYQAPKEKGIPSRVEFGMGAK